MEQVIITGATGVTGIALVRFLLEQAVKVTAILRPGTARRKYLPEHPNLTVMECDMKYYRTLGPLLSGKHYDVFYHLAWEGTTGVHKADNRNDMYLQNRNIAHTLDAVELCRQLGCGVFVAAGSQAEYGRTTEVISETTIEKPETGYGCAKLCAGNMSRILCRKYGIRHVWARLFSIYGPYDSERNNLINYSIAKLLQNENPGYTKGEQRWDYLYSFDAAKALWLLGDLGKAGEIYCIGYGEARPLSEYIRILHRTVNPEILPVFGEIPYQEDQVMNLCLDITKLKQDTGFEAEVEFCKGIQKVYAWYEKEGMGT